VFFVFTVVVAALIKIKKYQDLFQKSTETRLYYTRMTQFSIIFYYWLL